MKRLILKWIKSIAFVKKIILINDLAISIDSKYKKKIYPSFLIFRYLVLDFINFQAQF